MKLKAIWHLLTSKQFVIILTDGEAARSYTNAEGTLEDVIITAQAAYQAYDSLMSQIIEQATDSGELATAQAFQKAILRQEKINARD